MIRDVEGDILLTRAELIAHGIATHDPFDSGLALALRERWPGMVRDLRHHTHSHPLKAGDIWTWAGVDEDGGIRKIANLATQEMLDQGKAARPGKARLEHVGHALKHLAKFIKTEGIKSVALPRLATGVGGLQWADVKPLIQSHLGDLGIPVVVYETYHKNERANEKLT